MRALQATFLPYHNKSSHLGSRLSTQSSKFNIISVLHKL